MAASTLAHVTSMVNQTQGHGSGIPINASLSLPSGISRLPHRISATRASDNAELNPPCIKATLKFRCASIEWEAIGTTDLAAYQPAQSSHPHSTTRRIHNSSAQDTHTSQASMTS